ncbi:MAG: pyroglutamyl-peptidase I [Hyphomicrobium sp.]|nr:pyroglutamyl-peptidase I [Hyphomicrobium sp.]
MTHAIHGPTGTVLLTGFGPFPGVAANATARLVPLLAQTAASAFPSHVFHHDVLDTTWGAAPGRAMALIARHRPSLALHFGVAASARGFRIERQAHNICRLSPDATGCLPSDARLSQDGPDLHPVSIDTAKIEARLKARGFPVSLSDDAGGYLCNAVLYHSLTATKAVAAACRSGFIHIPADLEGPPLSFPDALEGALEIVRACLEDRDAATIQYLAD